jgi:hypothetical protein
MKYLGDRQQVADPRVGLQQCAKGVAENTAAVQVNIARLF